jgi:two-component sensor histidine kinase
MSLALSSAADAGGVAVKQENAHLRAITDELSHRIKNLVAIIQSIARQTMHQTSTKEDFETRFSGRLGAFGRSLDLLIANDWHGARIDELVRSELTPFGVCMVCRFRSKDLRSPSIRTRHATLALRSTSWPPTLPNMAPSLCQRARLPCIGSSRAAVDGLASG